MDLKGESHNIDYYRKLGFQVSTQTELGKKNKNILTLSLNTTKKKLK